MSQMSTNSHQIVSQLHSRTKSAPAVALPARPSAKSAPLSVRIGTAPRSGPLRTAALSPRNVSNPTIPSHKSVIELLSEFVNRRYDPSRQYLDLEASSRYHPSGTADSPLIQQRMAQDETFRKHKMTPLDGVAPLKQLGAVLFKLASQLQPPPTTISFANNNFVSTRPLITLLHYLPEVRALSFANNKLPNLRALDGISSKHGKPIGHANLNGGLNAIQELLLEGNPVRDIAIKENTYDSFRA